MAAEIVDSITSSGSSPFSILIRLPTRRLDAAITAARESDLPEQGEQTGGYTIAYAHRSHLPLLPLYSEAQHGIRAKQQARKERVVRQMDVTGPDKLLSGSEKTALSVLGALTGGGGLVSAKRWERRLLGVNVMSSNMLLQQHKLTVFTRWTVPTMRGTPWFVDVLEHRFLDPSNKMGDNTVYLKAGLVPCSAKKDNKVTLKLLKTDAKDLKSQKRWTKRLNSDPCEAITFIGDAGEEVPIEIVARIQRACSAPEALEMIKRFDKQWVVPVLQ